MATVNITNTNQLVKIFQARVKMAVKMTQDDIYKTIQRYITAYYEEGVFSGGSCIPDVYERTYRLLNSLIKTDIKVSGNSISCTVEIDRNYLNYSYQGGATGQQVMDWLNDSWHGGTVQGEHEYWNEALTELSGEQGIIWLMKYYLHKCGVPVV